MKWQLWPGPWEAQDPVLPLRVWSLEAEELWGFFFYFYSCENGKMTVFWRSRDQALVAKWAEAGR